MYFTIRRSIFLVLLATLFALSLTACTRERPTPEPTATLSVGAETSDSQPTEPPAVVEPQVATATPEEDVDLTVTTTPALETPAASSPETFQYVVREGDTLAGIAIRFETDLEELRRLNNLNDDILIVGQPINVPYVEGITAEGLPTPTPGPFAYTIQEGDTLTALAVRFGVDPIQIIERNNLLSPDNLPVGIEIIIPGYQPPADAAATDDDEGVIVTETSASVVHTVRTGESLAGIALQYGVSTQQIIDANNIFDANTLRVGQELIIPGVTEREAAAAQGQIHVVDSGESLLGIAVRYGITIEEIMEINDLDDANAIFIGQELIIPAP